VFHFQYLDFTLSSISTHPIFFSDFLLLLSEVKVGKMQEPSSTKISFGRED